MLPEAIDDDSVITGAVPAHPGHKSGRKQVGRAGGTERVQPQREALHFRVGGMVERYDLYGVAVTQVHGGEAAHGLGRTTTSGADGGHDVKESHGRRG